VARKRRSARRATLVPTALLALAHPVFAADGSDADARPVRFWVGYGAHQGCPTALEVLRGIQSRARQAVATDEETADVRLEITLAPEGERTAGSLVVTLPDGTRSERSVADASCEAAAASLAVMSALVLDGALPAARPVPPDESHPAPPPPPPAAARETRPRAAMVPAPPPPSPTPLVLELAARVHASWESAVAPGVALGLLAGGEVAWKRAGWFSPAVSASVLYVPPHRTSTSTGAASFRLVAARLDGCPLRIPLPLGASARVCAALDAGALRGEGDERVPNHATRTMPWLAGGLALRGAVPLGAGVALEAAAAARGLARHDRFVFRPDERIYDVPRISAGISAGVSYTF
jgi:hypothetical protein